MKVPKYTKKTIPDIWKPWIEIARDVARMTEIVTSAHEVCEDVGKLVASVLSAAKWLTGDSKDLGMDHHTFCGFCVQYRPRAQLACRIDASTFVPCPFGSHPRCVYLASDGASMMMFLKYAENKDTLRLYDEWQAGAVNGGDR